MSEPQPPPPGQDEAPPPELHRTVIRGVSVSTLGFFGSQVLNLAIYIVLARLLVPEEFGAYAAASLLIAVTLLLTNSGVSSAVVQRRDRVQEAASTAVVVTCLTGIASSLMMLALAPVVGTIFDSAQIGAAAAVLAGTTLIQSVGSIPEVMLQRRFSFVHQSVIVPIQVAVFGIVSITCAAADLGIWALVIGQYAAVTTDTTLNWLVARWRPDFSLASLGMARELLSFGRHVFASMLIAALPQQLDALIVGKAFGTAALGQFRYGFRLASTAQQVLTAGASYVIYPALARISHEPERIRAALLRSIRWICLVGAPLSLALAPLGVPLAVTLFGDIWREAGHAAAAMCVYSLGGGIVSVVGESLKAAGRPRAMTPLYATVSGLSLAFMLLAIPLGFTAVAGGLSLAALIAGIYALEVASRNFAIERRAIAASVIGPLAAALVMVAALVGIETVVDAEDHSTLAAAGLLVLEGLAGLAVYVVALRVLAPGAITEIRSLISSARNRGAP